MFYVRTDGPTNLSLEAPRPELKKFTDTLMHSSLLFLRGTVFCSCCWRCQDLRIIIPASSDMSLHTFQDTPRIMNDDFPLFWQLLFLIMSCLNWTTSSDYVKDVVVHSR